MNLKEFLVLLMICVIWGLHFIVIKLTVGQNVEPLFYAALRMTFVAIILIKYLKWHEGQMIFVTLGGLGYGTLNYAFLFPALTLTTASAAAVAIELYVPFSIILSIIFLKERIGIWRSLGIAMAFTGVVIIASSKPPEAAGPYFLLGIIFIACGAMGEAVGAIAVKKVREVKPLELLAWFGVIGSICLWPLTFALEDNQLEAFNAENLWPFLAALSYTVILVSLVAHTSYYWLLQRLPVHMIAPSGLMTTLIGVGASALILSEPLGLSFLIGGALTLGGIALILWRNRAKAIKPYRKNTS